MNRERFKKVIVWLALACVFSLPVATTLTPPVSAQGHQRHYDRRARHYSHGRPAAYRPWAKSHYRYRHGYSPRGAKYYGRPNRYHRRYY
jgi:hypothetical protein